MRVSGVAKTYKVFDTPVQRLKDLIGLNGSHQDVHALQPTSFTLAPGETVAIVGANGSGKSTLLQLICGTLSSSAGSIERHGRIAALLELGAGFNPEFSGLENVFLNASINGLTRSQTEIVLPQILAFADIGEHVTQPVKTYSSGMYVRLAFAVAIHVEPEILIIDEALAVGDEAFQRKCFARLRDLQSRGVSILFVSHSAEAVVSLCDRALLLDQGKLLMDGVPKQVVAQYQKLLYARPEQRRSIREAILAATKPNVSTNSESEAGQDCLSDTNGVIHGNHENRYLHPTMIPTHPEFYIEGLEASCTDYVENGVSIEIPMLLDKDGFRVNVLQKGHQYCYRYRVTFFQAAKDVFFGTLLNRTDGVSLGGMCTASPNQLSQFSVDQGVSFWVGFTFNVNLNAGAYFFNAGVTGRTEQHDGFLARKVDALMFKVLPQANECATGAVDFSMSTFIQKVKSEFNE